MELFNAFEISIPRNTSIIKTRMMVIFLYQEVTTEIEFGVSTAIKTRVFTCRPAGGSQR